jgi:hypothetical protein
MLGKTKGADRRDDRRFPFVERLGNVSFYPRCPLRSERPMGYSEGAMRLGPVARKLIDPCAWKDGYPGPPAYVRELDALLHFANQNGYLRRFVPNLEARDRQRDRFLNELRLAYFFRSLGFDITEWDPPGANGKTGEFNLAVPDKPSVFVEVKSRGWESELSDLQLKTGLAKLSKYEVWRGGAVGNWKAVHECISFRQNISQVPAYAAEPSDHC